MAKNKKKRSVNHELATTKIQWTEKTDSSLQTTLKAKKKYVLCSLWHRLYINVIAVIIIK